MAHLPFNDPQPPFVRSDSWQTIDPNSEEANRPLADGPLETPEQRNEAEEAEFFKWWEEKCAQAYLEWTQSYDPNEFPDDFQEYDLEEKYAFYVLFRTIRDPTWRDDVPPMHEDLRRAREASRVGLRGV